MAAPTSLLSSRDDSASQDIRLGCQGKRPSRLFRKLADRLAASPSCDGPELRCRNGRGARFPGAVRLLLICR